MKQVIAYWFLFWNSLAIGYLFLTYLLTGEVVFHEDIMPIAIFELIICLICVVFGLIWLVQELKQRFQS